MRRLTKQNKIIVGVISLLLVLTVGYALFSETLNINGTAKASGEFNIVFDRVIKENIKRVGAPGADASISPTKNELEVRVPKLEFPTSYAEIPVVIKNMGTISARLKGIRTEGVDNTDIKVTYSGIAEDEVLISDEEKEMKIKVEWDKASTKNVDNMTFKIYLDYEQVGYASDGSITPAPIENDNFIYEGTKLVGLSSIGEEHYKSNKTLKIPEGTTEIADDAFLVPYGTPKENIPDIIFVMDNFLAYESGTISPEDKAKFEREFYKGTVLEKNNKSNNRLSGITIKFPNSLKIIGNASFATIDFEGDLVIPNSVTEIKGFAFGGTFDFSNTKVAPKGNLVLSESLTKVGMAAFKNTNFTGTLTVPEGVKKLEIASFQDNKFKGDLVLPNSIVTIGNATFHNAGFTGTLILPNTLTTIEGFTFHNCNFSGELYIPDNINKIGPGAFQISALNNKVTSISMSQNTTYESDSFNGRPKPTIRN